jgi:glycosyltransferase involved in cell wall biosynthesis
LYGENKWQAYRQAELFVLPTYSENFGMAVAEALAAGTPAIVSKGAPWENLEIHQAGWWIDIGLDPLVTCLESALSKTSAELAGMGVRGYNLMEREYSWPQISWKMVETYKWLLSQNTPPPSWIQID